MIVDTSALIAVLRNEPDTPVIKTALRQANSRKISAATLVEARVVMTSKAGAVLDATLCAEGGGTVVAEVSV